MNIRTYRILFFLWFLLLAGCQMAGADTRQEADDHIRILDLSGGTEDHSSDHEQYETDIKNIVQEVPAIFDVMVIQGQEETLVTYKVRQMQRFRMKKIEKELKKKLADVFPDESFTVSSDFKIFLESRRLQERMDQGKLTRDDAGKRLQEIIQLSKEKT